jgi:5'-nucleotidase
VHRAAEGVLERQGSELGGARDDGLEDGVEAAARDRRAEPLGVEVAAPIRAAYGEESALGNLVADLMRAARPAADVAITNGGGLRADLPAGTLSYGALYEALPFDNTFALERVTGAGLRRMVADNLAGTHGIFSLSGVRAVARCDGATLTVDLQRPDGTPIADDDAIVVATSNFLAAGGDGALAHAGATDIHIEDDPPIRDAVADMLRARGGTLRGDDAAIFDPERPRLVYPGTRPVRCP